MRDSRLEQKRARENPSPEKKIRIRYFEGGREGQRQTEREREREREREEERGEGFEGGEMPAAGASPPPPPASAFLPVPLTQQQRNEVGDTGDVGMGMDGTMTAPPDAVEEGDNIEHMQTNEGARQTQGVPESAPRPAGSSAEAVPTGRDAGDAGEGEGGRGEPTPAAAAGAVPPPPPTTTPGAATYYDSHPPRSDARQLMSRVLLQIGVNDFATLQQLLFEQQKLFRQQVALMHHLIQQHIVLEKEFARENLTATTPATNATITDDNADNADKERTGNEMSAAAAAVAAQARAALAAAAAAETSSRPRSAFHSPSERSAAAADAGATASVAPRTLPPWLLQQTAAAGLDPMSIWYENHYTPPGTAATSLVGMNPWWTDLLRAFGGAGLQADAFAQPAAAAHQQQQQHHHQQQQQQHQFYQHTRQQQHAAAASAAAATLAAGDMMTVPLIPPALFGSHTNATSTPAEGTSSGKVAGGGGRRGENTTTTTTTKTKRKRSVQTDSEDGDGVGVVPEVPTLHHQRQGQTDVDEQAVPSPPKTALGTGEEDDTL